MKFVLLAGVVCQVAGSKLKDLMESVANHEKEIVLNQMKERMQQLNSLTDYSKLAPVINRELQAFESLQDEINQDNFDAALDILIELKSDIKEQKQQELLATSALQQLSVEGEEEEMQINEETGYSWMTYLGLMTAVGAVSYGTYQVGKKSSVKSLYDDVMNENKVKTSRDQLLM